MFKCFDINKKAMQNIQSFNKRLGTWSVPDWTLEMQGLNRKVETSDTCGKSVFHPVEEPFKIFKEENILKRFLKA